MTRATKQLDPKAADADGAKDADAKAGQPESKDGDQAKAQLKDQAGAQGKDQAKAQSKAGAQPKDAAQPKDPGGGPAQRWRPGEGPSRRSTQGVGEAGDGDAKPSKDRPGAAPKAALAEAEQNQKAIADELEKMLAGLGQFDNIRTLWARRPTRC